MRVNKLRHNVLRIACLCALPLVSFSAIMDRTIIALYNSHEVKKLEETLVHDYAAMPLNYLGLKLRYIDVNSTLPDASKLSGVLGVLAWLPAGSEVKSPTHYLKWLQQMIVSGKRVVIMGDPGFYVSQSKVKTPLVAINRFYRLLGLRDDDQWVAITHDVRVVKLDPRLVNFEREVRGRKPPYHVMKVINANDDVYLALEEGYDQSTRSDMIVTGQHGGYVAAQYGVYQYFHNKTDVRKWYINPFKYFNKAFSVAELPKPDITTMAGRRIYFSHIDGDGWMNLTHLEQYKKKKAISAKVILEKVIQPYWDLPVTVAPIAAELDKDWFGNRESIQVAREILFYPNVEIGTHTYSHPFEWSFFKNYTPAKEKPFLSKYPGETWDSGFVKKRFSFLAKKHNYKKYGLSEKFDIPRAYAVKKYSLDREITGSTKKINSLAPPDKKVKIVMWSGNTLPYEAAIRKSREAGLLNINGGDSRYDKEYDSYAWVAPIALPVGRELQIYASNSNENTYTDLWQGRFHGFRYLLDTITRTETPIRIKPINIYYHMYSGEREASLDALLFNLNAVRKMNIIPITTSRFARIAKGFFTTQIDQLGERQWKILHRGQLESIRFADAVFKGVDFQASTGVIGQLHLHGSLYVYLDQLVNEPVITLTQYKESFGWANVPLPYLIDSRWRIWNLTRRETGFTFKCAGYGYGEMNWHVGKPGRYMVTVTNQLNKRVALIGKSADEHKQLKFTIEQIAIHPVNVSVKYEGP